MKIFVINLDKNIERLNKITSRLDGLGLPFERFPAILGRALSEEEKSQVVNRFLWWCAGGRPVMDGEIGCALSHLGVYRKMIADGLDMACIFEDDVILDERLSSQLARIAEWVDVNSSQVVLLSNYSRRQEAEGEIVEESSASFADGYVLTRMAAMAILKENFPLRVAADSWTRWIRSGAIRCYHAFPPVCRQDWTEEYRSDVCTEWHGFRETLSFGKLAFKIGRIFGKMVDKVTS